MLNGLCPWGDPLHVGHDQLYFICSCSLCFVYFLATMLPYRSCAPTNRRSARFRGWFANRESLKSDLCSRGKLVESHWSTPTRFQTAPFISCTRPMQAYTSTAQQVIEKEKVTRSRLTVNTGSALMRFDGVPVVPSAPNLPGLRKVACE